VPFVQGAIEAREAVEAGVGCKMEKFGVYSKAMLGRAPAAQGRFPRIRTGETPVPPLREASSATRTL